MNQQFKLKKEGYYKGIKQMFMFGLLFTLSFTGVMIIIFYLTGTDWQKLFDSKFIFSFLPFFFLPFLMQFLSGWRRAKVNYKSYKIRFEDDCIIQEQLSYWNDIFFLISDHSIGQRRMPYREITEIRKSNTGYYTIKGKEDSYPNTITISSNIANTKGLEETLSEIKPIKPHHEVADLKEYPVNKLSISNSRSLFFDVKSIKIIFGGYFIALLFSYFWFTPINWSLVIFCSIIYFLWMFFIFFIVIKNNNGVFPIVMDNTAFIVERIKGNPVAMPFEEITSIKKRSFQFIITGKKISTSLPNQILIPTNIEGIKPLEQKLNSICLINYIG